MSAPSPVSYTHLQAHLLISAFWQTSYLEIANKKAEQMPVIFIRSAILLLFAQHRTIFRNMPR